MSRTLVCLLLQAAVSHSLDSSNTDIESSEAKVGWYSGPMERGTLSLVWSCVATIIACTWTILHLNVPRQGESPKTKTFRKAKWMAITILFPEFIFSKAVCELRLALKTLREFRETMMLHHRDDAKRTMFERNTGSSSSGWVAQEEDRTLSLLYRVMGLGALRSADRRYLEADREPDVELGSIRRGSFGGSTNSAPVSTVKAYPHIDKGFSGTGSGEAFTNGRGITSTTHREIEVDEYTGEAPSKTRHINNTSPKVALRDGQDQTWTLLHSYLANMGGIVYMNSEESLRTLPRLVLTGYHLGRHYQWEGIHPLRGLRLSRNDIADKSKADWLLKSLSVLQILSLIITVTVRGVTSLPLTQLEIATVAFSIIAIMTYAANWWKPKDISEPVVVLHETHGRDISNTGRTNRNSDHSTFDYTVSFVEELMNPSKTYDLKGLVRDAPYVSNDTIDMHGDIPLVVLLMAVSSLLFGGLHCLAWNFDFPSDAELQLWRVASISSALIPMIALGLTVLLNYMGIKYTYTRILSQLTSKTKDHMVHSKSYSDFLTAAQAWERERLRISSNIVPLLEVLLKSLKEVHHMEPNGLNLGRLHLPITRLVEYRKRQRGLWIEFEDFEKSYFNIPSLEYESDDQPNTFSNDIIKIVLAWDKENGKYVAKTQGLSIIVPILGGAAYTLSRLINMAIMFSSLRAVPKDIYVNTPWTRFVPSFS